MKKNKKIIIVIMTVVFCTVMLSDRETYASSMKSGFDTVKAVVPTLFPFLIASNVLCGITETNGRKNKFCEVFKLKSGAFLFFIAGNVCGFPVGASAASRIYKDTDDKKGAVRFAVLCNNVSVSFAASFVGSFLIRDVKTGIVLWLIQLTCAIIVCFFDVLFDKKALFIEEKQINVERDIKFIGLFTDSVSRASSGCVGIASYICFFSVVGSYIAQFLSKVGLSFLSGKVPLILEISSGCRASLDMAYPANVLGLAFTLGFSGLSVICQSASYLVQSDIPTVRFTLMKLIQGVLSALASFAILGKDFTKIKSAPCAVTHTGCVLPCVVCIMCAAVHIIFKIKEMRRTT